MSNQMDELQNRLVQALSDSNEALDVVAHIKFMTLVTSASNCLSQRIAIYGAQTFASQAELSAFAFRYFVTNHNAEYKQYRKTRCKGDYMIANGPVSDAVGVLSYLLILSVPAFNRLLGDIPIQQ